MSSSTIPTNMNRSKNISMEIATVEFIAPAVTSANPVIQKTKNNSVNKPKPNPNPIESSFNQPSEKLMPIKPNGLLSTHLSTIYAVKRNEIVMNRYCISIDGVANPSDSGR